LLLPLLAWTWRLQPLGAELLATLSSTSTCLCFAVAITHRLLIAFAPSCTYFVLLVANPPLQVSEPLEATYPSWKQFMIH
jgi:hypothetical protein